MRARTRKTIAPSASVPRPNAIAPLPVDANKNSQPASAISGGSGYRGTRNGASGCARRASASATTWPAP
jgi:hypothetical protein